MSGGKLVAVVLVAIAMLFVVGLALGSNKHDGTPSTGSTGLLSHLQAGRFLQATGNVTVSGCASSSPGLVVVTSSPCALDVPAGGAFARPTRFALKPALALHVSVAPRRNGPTLEQNLNAGDCLGGAFDGKGGTVVLGPTLGPPAGVQLLTQRCP
ncbi:MAG: hypothetical protein ACXVFN_00245 [Solirubrobacteraceae bacterium]